MAQPKHIDELAVGDRFTVFEDDSHIYEKISLGTGESVNHNCRIVDNPLRIDINRTYVYGYTVEPLCWVVEKASDR